MSALWTARPVSSLVGRGQAAMRRTVQRMSRRRRTRRRGKRLAKGRTTEQQAPVSRRPQIAAVMESLKRRWKSITTVVAILVVAAAWTMWPSGQDVDIDIGTSVGGLTLVAQEWRDNGNRLVFPPGAVEGTV